MVSLALIPLITTVIAQADSLRKVSVRIKIIDTGLNETRGYVHSMTDTALYIMHTRKFVHAAVGGEELYKINPDLLNTVSIRKARQAGKAIAFGILAGAVGGAVIGYATYQDPGPDTWFDFGPGFSALAGATIGTLAGSLTGVIISLIPVKYIIDGNRNNYKAMQLNFYKRITKKHRRAKS